MMEVNPIIKTFLKKRSNSVKNLLENLGIDEAQIKAVGFGEGNPIDTNNTSEGRTNNRRVVFRLSD